MFALFGLVSYKVGAYRNHGISRHSDQGWEEFYFIKPKNVLIQNLLLPTSLQKIITHQFFSLSQWKRLGGYDFQFKMLRVNFLHDKQN